MHTNMDGAKVNRGIVVAELKRINPGKVKEYLR
jgi:hypothetical protein